MLPKSIAPEILSRYNISIKNKSEDTVTPSANATRQTLALMTQPALNVLRHPLNPFAYLPGTWLVASALERLAAPVSAAPALAAAQSDIQAEAVPARKERVKAAPKRARKVVQEAVPEVAASAAATALDAPAGDVLVCQDDSTINGAVVPPHPKAVMALSFYDAPRRQAAAAPRA